MVQLDSASKTTPSKAPLLDFVLLKLVPFHASIGLGFAEERMLRSVEALRDEEESREPVILSVPTYILDGEKK